ncbi:MAG: F0F1 ATP synthase subunit B [Lachnospiraceae bacterium]|nr:F0F1 ATP synthase subunit B [Lachnospiraceae bacterium]
MSRLFGLDLQLGADFFLSVIAIFVLFFAFSFLLFNPVRKMLNNRKQRIHDEIKDAADIKQEAEKFKAEYEDKLKNIDKEAEEILSSARKRALEGENRVIEEAREEADRIIAHARTEAELEKQKAMDEVKREMIVVASMMAEKVVSEKIDTTIQDKLVEDTLKEIGKSTWQN